MLLLYKELEFDRIEVEVFEFAVGIVNNKMKERRWSCRMQQTFSDQVVFILAMNKWNFYNIKFYVTRHIGTKYLIIKSIYNFINLKAW